ncbi:MAG TPA: outer membrane beta-barrel protein [Bacteroidales bacterium]|nr:outer membrane beta-barrel protein [Bacteroidales bacterium]
MKKFYIVILLSAALVQVFGQEIYAVMQQDEKRDSTDNERNKEVIIGRNFLRIDENDSALNVRVGNRGLSVLESLESGRDIKIQRYDSERDEWVDRHEYRERRQDREYREPRRSRFRGNWSGLEIGFNNYTTSRSRQLIPDPIDYMTLHSGKSNNFNINFSQLSIGLTRHIGFVTGLGINWNNYRFDGNNNITKGEGGRIDILDPGADLKKSKFATVYLTAPFLLEMQLPVTGGNHLNLAAGPIGAVKLFSHSKMVFEDNQKVKSNSDFNLNLLRYGATARVGYSNLQVYGTYYFTPLFRSGDGPGGWDLFPYEVGLAFTIFN